MKFFVLKPMLLGLAVLISLPSYAALFIRDLDGDLSNGHEGVYDDVLDITWLADANLAKTNTFGLPLVGYNYPTFQPYYDHNSGGMTWHVTQDYASAANNFNAGDGYLGYSSWRLPKVTPLNGISYVQGGNIYDGSGDEGFNISAPISEYNPTGASPGATRNELAYHYYNNFGARAPSSGDSVNGAAENSYPDSIWGLDDATKQESVALFDNIDEMWHWTSLYKGGNSNSWIAFNFEQGQTNDRGYTDTNRVWLVHDGDIGTAASAVPIPATAWLFGSALLGLYGLRQRT